MGKKPVGITLYAAPVVVMIGLATLIADDWILAAIYVVIIVALFLVQHERVDFIAFFFGLFIMTFFEWLFVSTEIETFVRNSLFGVMPVWLPILWGYGFVAIRRSLVLISEQ